MSPHEIQKPVFERQDERGIFQEVVNTGQWEALIVAHMEPDAVLGNHYHKKTVLFLYIVAGSARITTIHVETDERDVFTLQANQGVSLPPLQAHAIRFLEPSDVVILKSHAYDPDDPDTFPLTVPEG